MIIKELRLGNFLVFPGEQALELPTDGESNLVVILAPNNTGKTNIIRALKFLFYGHLPDCNEVTAYRLIHDGVREAAHVGTEVSGWVEATLELDDEELTLRRTVKARKMGKDQWMAAEITFGKLVREPKLRLFLDSDGVYQTKIRTMVPEQLFDAFYFKGEPLDGKLLGGVGAIRDSLASFLHEDRWEEVERAAEQVRQRYTSELRRLADKNQVYTRLLNDEELFRGHVVKEEAKLEKKKEDLEDAIAKFNELTGRLQDLGRGNEAEKWVVQLRDLRSRQETARRTSEKADAEIARLVGSSRGIPFLLSAMPAARKILAALQEENILPADVSERFVDRVLAAPTCVCGRSHDDQTRLAWNRYKAKTLSLDMNRGLSDLLNALQDSNSHSFSRVSAEVARKIQDAQARRKQALLDLANCDAPIQDLEKKLKASPLEEIRVITQKLRETGNLRDRLKGEVAQLENSIRGMRQNLNNIKCQLEKARPAGAAAVKERRLQQARARAEKLRLLIHESREALTRTFHELLQQSVTEYYDQSAYDGSKARINRATLLPSIESNGQIHGNLGGGQSQLLALAYIVSLSRLRKSLHTQMQELGIGFGRVDDQSFFLDSPFNHVTEHYAQAIARFLAGNARQVIVLVARQQWTLVRTMLEPAARKLLGFKYHTLKEKLKELRAKDPKLEDFVYDVNGCKVSLIEELPKSEAGPFTTIIPIH